MFEAAQNGCVLAVLSDPWNLVERYFEPDEYVSLSTSEELYGIVRDVRTNPLRYVDMVNRAATKASRYTTKHLSERIDEIARNEDE